MACSENQVKNYAKMTWNNQCTLQPELAMCLAFQEYTAFKKSDWLRNFQITWYNLKNNASLRNHLKQYGSHLLSIRSNNSRIHILLSVCVECLLTIPNTETNIHCFKNTPYAELKKSLIQNHAEHSLCLQWN